MSLLSKEFIKILTQIRIHRNETRTIRIVCNIGRACEKRQTARLYFYLIKQNMDIPVMIEQGGIRMSGYYTHPGTFYRIKEKSLESQFQINEGRLIERIRGELKNHELISLNQDSLHKKIKKLYMEYDQAQNEILEEIQEEIDKEMK